VRLVHDFNLSSSVDVGKKRHHRRCWCWVAAACVWSTRGGRGRDAQRTEDGCKNETRQPAKTASTDCVMSVVCTTRCRLGSAKAYPSLLANTLNQPQ
jgi:hypothetical protein